MTINEKIDAITSLIAETTNAVLRRLSSKEEFDKLNLEITSKLVLELVLFLLHFCDRQIFCLAGSEDREIIMVGVLENVLKWLEKYDEKVLAKHFGEKTNSNLNVYFEYLSKMALSTDFRGAYNERQQEYAVYKKLFPDKDEPPKDTLVWEFSKKIVLLVKSTPAGMLIMLSLSSDMIEAFIITLKSFFGTESWEKKLENVDFIKARSEIADMFKIAKEDAKMKGGEHYIEPKFYEALLPFMTQPCLRSAINLLEFNPILYTYFEQSKK